MDFRLLRAKSVPIIIVGNSRMNDFSVPTSKVSIKNIWSLKTARHKLTTVPDKRASLNVRRGSLSFPRVGWRIQHIVREIAAISHQMSL